MKASLYEQELAQTDGVLIRDNLRPLRLIARSGRLTGVEFAYEGSGEVITLLCDQLFKAIGQTFSVDHVDGTLALSGGRIAVDAERRTSLANVWAGGDCIAGGQDLTVAAVEDGKQAAIAMHRALTSNEGA
jgi:glutamate synthase (NADPH/NADH) small chain